MVARLEGAWTHPVVTARAGAGLAGYGGVIKAYSQPGGGVVTGIALGGGRDVVGAFSTGNSTVMTIRTRIGCLRMIYGQYK